LGWTSVLENTRLTLTGTDVQPKLRVDFMPFGFSATCAFDGDLVFAGYGVVNTDDKHDDYAGLDVAGKVVLLLRREPPAWDGPRWTDHATFQTKVARAAERQAVGVLIVNQAPEGSAPDDLTHFYAGGPRYALPVLHIRRTLANALLKAGGLADLDTLQQKLDAGAGPVSAPLPGLHAAGEVASTSNETLARNVVAVLPGTGPHANEYVAVGAHYDHLGEVRGQIMNGADDNASGTAGVIEIARALAQAPQRDRSLLCLAFSAEEMGLLGSGHYVDAPTVPIEQIVVMVNLDMIGRGTFDRAEPRLSIVGVASSPAFRPVLEHWLPATPLAGTLVDSVSMGGSDDQPFHAADIPTLFFHTGVHADYHRPTDDTEAINAEAAAWITGLAAQTVLELLNAPERPEFVEVAASFSPYFRPGIGGVVMGIMPDGKDDPNEPGWAIAQVMPDGPAQEAGIQGGDIIMEIDGLPVRGLPDWRRLVAGKKAGDVISVKVRRGTDELTKEVTLTERKQP